MVLVMVVVCGNLYCTQSNAFTVSRCISNSSAYNLFVNIVAGIGIEDCHRFVKFKLLVCQWYLVKIIFQLFGVLFSLSAAHFFSAVVTHFFLHSIGIVKRKRD